MGKKSKVSERGKHISKMQESNRIKANGEMGRGGGGGRIGGEQLKGAKERK